MRRRAWAAWACLALGIGFGLLGRVAPGAGLWNLLAGLFLLAAIVLALSLLRLATRLVPSLEPFPDLFDPPNARERWCDTCGHPTVRSGPCTACGATPPSRGKGA